MGQKLSEILQDLLDLKAIDLDASTIEVKNLINQINEIVSKSNFINKNELRLAENQLKSSLAEYQTLVKIMQDKIETNIHSNLEEYLKVSEEIYKTNSEQMLFHEHKEWAPLWPPDDIEVENFIAQIERYMNFQFPGAIVGANNNLKIFSAINAIEPFYIIEQYPEYFELQKEILTPVSIKKYRWYNLNDLEYLPDNGIGLIVIFNEFQFLSWPIVISLLESFTKKLMPEGKLIFTYNDCDTVLGFREFENKNMTYSTQNMYDKFLSKHNMEFIYKYNSNRQPFNYLIYNKKGKRNLIKSAGAYGFVRDQPTFNNKHNHVNRIEFIKSLVAKSME